MGFRKGWNRGMMQAVGVILMLFGLSLLSLAPNISMRLLRLSVSRTTSFDIAVAYGMSECYAGDSFIVYGTLSHSEGYVWGGSGVIYVDGNPWGNLLITTGGYVSEYMSISTPGTHSIYFVATEYGVTPSWSGADVKYYTDPITSNVITVVVKEKPTDPDVLLVSLAYDGVSKSKDYGLLRFIAGVSRQSTKYGTQGYNIAFKVTLQVQSGVDWTDVDCAEAVPNTWTVRFAYYITRSMVGMTLKFRAVAEGHGAYGVSEVVSVTITQDMFGDTQTQTQTQTRTQTQTQTQTQAAQPEVVSVRVETPVPVIVSDGRTSVLVEDGGSVLVEKDAQVKVESATPIVDVEPRVIRITQDTEKITINIVPAELRRYSEAMRITGISLIVAGAAVMAASMGRRRIR